MSVFTPEQVQILNENQVHVGDLLIHPFTCINRGDARHAPVNSITDVLIATTAGWVCPFCDYTQNWAHAAMLERPAAARVPSVMANLLRSTAANNIDAALLAYLRLEQLKLTGAAEMVNALMKRKKLLS